MAEQELPAAFCDPAAFAVDADVAIALLAELQIRRAIDRGEFDDLPGSGRPLDLSDHHDPEWWLKSLMQREGFQPPLPPSIQLRKDDAALDDQLDRLPTEAAVRHETEAFNQRVISARYQLPAGPPLITMPRDVDATTTAWAARRAARIEAARAKALEDEQERRRASGRERRRWRRRR
ncbi:DnaJ family domain-containing protein [Agrococcus baldri]|uniref:DnaJ homologue subfamily C member 28 conserved domain-containing protein n=1 Tax=Agrococcus baldri TaxID=153730 RepID=A0AA87RJ98_9MICO|nr:DUF1992 domain-containing protein [Agrococcus baldri]GEK81205.1 hypothetical protein ABA31_25560 [Agrococcus baldri]